MNDKGFLTEHSCFVTEHAVQKLTQPLFKALQINYFGQTRLLRNGSLSALVSQAKLADFWYQEQFPIPGTSQGKFALTDGMYFAKTLQAYLPVGMLDKLRYNFNVDYILFIVKNQPRYIDIYMLAAPPEQTQMINIYLNSQVVLQRFLRHFEQQSKQLMITAMLQTVNLPPQVTDAKILANICQQETYLLDQIDAQAQQNIFPTQHHDKIAQLTSRQQQCLQLMLKGFSYRAIAAELHISPRTVETHVEQIKQKLHCQSKHDILALFHS